ncbi:MAG: methyl-accepting chemotaxis protein [Desulfovibrio sp.]
MKIKSIQLKIAGIAGIFLVLAVCVVVLFGQIYTSMSQKYAQDRFAELQTQSALETLEALSGKQAFALKSEFEFAMDAARTMAQTFAVIKQRDRDGNSAVQLNREGLNAILRNVLKENPTFNGTYSCWEPDKFDNEDENYRTGKSGSNAITGRFTPYWTRDKNGNIDVQPLVEYDSDEKHPNGVPKGGWYITPKTKSVESILGPLPYIVQGRNVWLATMSAPIIVDGTFYGVAGADYDLSFVQKLSEDVDANFMDGKGNVTVISDLGLIVGSSEHPELIGRHMKELSAEEWEHELEIITSGKSAASIDAANGMAVAYAAIPVGRTGKYWGVIVHAPTDVVLEEVKQLSGELDAQGRESAFWQILVSLGVGILAVCIMWFSAGGIAKPIRRAAELAGIIRDGVFSERLQLRTQDEVGQLGNALDEMAESLQRSANVAEQIANGNLAVEVDLASDKDQLGGALQEMSRSLNESLEQVRSAAEQIASGSAEISDSSQSLSQGATESAASLEEITSSMTQMLSQTKLNAENANLASEMSGAARAAAENGNRQMQEMISAMGEINTAGQSIGKIIKVIDEIAFQTNLLALNAAVEAARAGQHGKGFAVVAEEVRNLAARSAKAASETSELIQESVQKAANGADIADKTAAALEEIVTGISKATSLISDIAKASAEQAEGIAQIDDGLGQIDQVTQQNTANAEESAAAATALSNQASELRRLLRRFELKRGHGAERTMVARNVAMGLPAPGDASDQEDDEEQVERNGEELRRY